MLRFSGILQDRGRSGYDKYFETLISHRLSVLEKSASTKDDRMPVPQISFGYARAEIIKFFRPSASLGPIEVLLERPNTMYRLFATVWRCWCVR
jgi:hypothetical protein